jgi:hypothetical protein
MRGCLVIGLGLLLGLTAAWAGDGGGTAPAPSTSSGPGTQPAVRQAPPQGTQPAEIDRLIGQLGAESWLDRHAAEEALVKIGQPAIGALEKAVWDYDGEHVARAKAALARIRLPETIQRLGRDLAKAGLLADKHTFRPDKDGLAIIDQIEEIGNGDACNALLMFIRTPRQDRLLRKEAVCALGRIGTQDALKCLTSFRDWADRRIEAREGEFRFGRWDKPSEHFSGEELKPWLAARDANGVEWTAFIWRRFGDGHVWVTRRLGKDKWLPPVMTDLEQGKLEERKDLTLQLDGSGLRIKSKDGATDLPLAMLEADGDTDRLPDAAEEVFGTDPKKADTDNDGVDDGKDVDPTVPASPKPTESDAIRQAVFYAVYSTCDSWAPIYMPKGGQEFKGYRGGIVRTARMVPGRFNVAIDAPQISGDSADVHFRDYFGAEAAASYRATLKKVKDRWVVVIVEMLRIS